MRILVTDDDPTMTVIVRRLLEEDGHAVDVAESSESARTLAMVTDYDALVLDLVLPDGHGIPLIQRLRREGMHKPILVLTGTKDPETTVRALDAGADDYVTKPIVFEEFKARVRALLRRGGSQRTEQITVGNTVLNRLTRTLLVDGKAVKLTPKQLALLEHLMLRVGEVVTRTQLLDKVHDLAFDPGTNVIDVNVSRLRRTLEEAGSSVEIVARRGIGFVLEGS